MLKRIALLSSILILFLSFKPLYAVKTKTVQNNELIVQHEKSLRIVANEVMKIYPDVKLELEKTFKWKINFKPIVLLIKDRKTFQNIAGNNPVVALAVPQKNLIVIDNSRMKTHPFTLKITLKHELCHLLLHKYVKGGNLPKWLNEGISQWASEGIAEIIIGGNKDLLKQATLSGRFIPIRNLTGHLYQILFSLAALVLIYGFIRLLIRRRAYKDEEDD